MANNYHVLIPCAGHGSRFGSDLPKQYQPLLNQTVLDWTLNAFLDCHQISSITVVHTANDPRIVDYARRYPKVSFVAHGGATRAESVINGLKALAIAENDWVLVHDAARCCVDVRDVAKLIDKLSLSKVGGILASNATDTIKLVTDDLTIQKTIDRKNVYLAQTPQMFRYNLLLNALEKSDLNIVTDEASALELCGYSVQVVKADYPNLKVTYAHDLIFAANILKARMSSIGGEK